MEPAVIRFCRGVVMGALLGVLFLTLVGSANLALDMIRGAFGG